MLAENRPQESNSAGTPGQGVMGEKPGQMEEKVSFEPNADGFLSPEAVEEGLRQVQKLKELELKEKLSKEGGVIEVKADFSEEGMAQMHTVEDLKAALENNVDHRISEGIRNAFSSAENSLQYYGSQFAYGNPENILQRNLDGIRAEFEGNLEFAHMPGKLREILMPKMNDLFEGLVEQAKIKALRDKVEMDEFNVAEQEANKKADAKWRNAQDITGKSEVVKPKKSWWQVWK